MEFVPLRKFIDMLPVLIPMIDFAEKLEREGEVALATAFRESMQFATANGTVHLRFKMADGVLKEQLRAMARNQGFDLP